MDFLSSPWLIGPIAVVCIAALYVLSIVDGANRPARTALRLVVYAVTLIVAVLIIIRFEHLALTPKVVRD